MTTTEATPDTSLGTLLLRSARTPHRIAATQALVDEETLLGLPQVSAALVVEEDGVPTCRWEGLAGKLYTLGLTSQQRDFLGLVLGMVGIGTSTLATIGDLDDRHLMILMRAIPRLAGNDRIAVGTRM